MQIDRTLELPTCPLTRFPLLTHLRTRVLQYPEHSYVGVTDRSTCIRGLMAAHLVWDNLLPLMEL